MPYMHLYTCNNLTLDQKKNLVKDMTEAAVRSLNLTPEQKSMCTVHFDIINPENIAVGGSLISDSKRPCNHLEVMAPQLQQDQIERLCRELTTVVSKQFNLTDEAIKNLGCHVQTIEPNRMAMGGQMMTANTRR